MGIPIVDVILKVDRGLSVVAARVLAAVEEVLW